MAGRLLALAKSVGQSPGKLFSSDFSFLASKCDLSVICFRGRIIQLWSRGQCTHLSIRRPLVRIRSPAEFFWGPTGTRVSLAFKKRQAPGSTQPLKKSDNKVNPALKKTGISVNPALKKDRHQCQPSFKKTGTRVNPALKKDRYQGQSILKKDRYQGQPCL